jgi:hypothetical protein
MINALLSTNKTKTVTIYTQTQTVTDGVLGEPVFALSKTLTAIYWKACGSKANISDKYKEQVEACIIVDPALVSESDITTDCKITVSGEGDYRLVYADNIGAQDKILQLNMKEWA